MMQLEYVAHSCFRVQCGSTSLLFDPWLNGPAYFKQWYLWPLPSRKAEEADADVVLISHGHEDHLHTESLRAIDKRAHVFFPFQWRAGIKPFLHYTGFRQVTEAVSFRTYKVNDVRITYIGYSLESVVVIEHQGEVLVNINDALNSNHENAVSFLLKEIRKRWPKIDYLLSGWSGASYFPNQIRYPGKDDREIGRLREQYFANNFCTFTHELAPAIAIPFAPGFVLLEEQNRWINHVKFPRKKVHEYFRSRFGDTPIQFLLAYPGDRITNGILEKRSALHHVNEEDQPALAYRHYEKEMKETGFKELVSRDDIAKLCNDLRYWMNFNRQLYDPLVLADAEFSIELEDTPTETYLNITSSEDRFFVAMDSVPLAHRKLTIRTTAKKLAYGLKKVWGGDVLSIGYGLVVDVYDQLTLEKNLDIVCVRLITRYPIARHDLLKFPMRALRYYTQNPRLTSLWLQQKIALKPYVNKYPYNERDHWMTYDKCALCAVCKMPQIDLEKYAAAS